jgi:hypothetical protein
MNFTGTLVAAGAGSIVSIDSSTGKILSEVDPIGWTKNRPFLDGAAG